MIESVPGTPARHARIRDLLVVAGVVLIAGVALADAVRGDGGEAAPPTTTAPAVTETAPPEPEEFPGVTAPGSIVFLDAAGCAIRQVVVASGSELRLPRIETGCDLWAAPRGGRVAYALEGPDREFRPFRFLDLARPAQRLGTFQTFSGVTWSGDGRRALWCHNSGRGFELELGASRPRMLPGCPVAFSPHGEPAYAEAERLVVDGRTVHAAGGMITFATWGRDRSLAVAVEGGRLERVVRGEVAGSSEGAVSGSPLLAPDNCAAAFADGDAEIEIVGLCGEREATARLEGTAAAWSPDGNWLAVANGDEIVFHHLTGTLGTVRWPAEARALAWVR